MDKYQFYSKDGFTEMIESLKEFLELIRMARVEREVKNKKGYQKTLNKEDITKLKRELKKQEKDSWYKLY